MIRILLMTLAVVMATMPARADEGTAMRTVVESLRRSPRDQREFMRYVWLQPGIAKDTAKAEVDYAINMAMGGSGPIVTSVWMRNREVIGFNLLALAHSREDAKRLADAWDSLAVRDPVFHLPGDVQGLESVVLAPHMSRYVDYDGRRFDVLACELTDSVAPIYDHRFLLNELLETSYLRFRGIKVGSDVEKHLTKRGYPMAQYADGQFVRANFMLRSKVTGEQRVIAAYQGIVSPVPATVTYDLRDGTTEPEKQFSRNLLTFPEVSEGSEVFIPLRNGLIEFLLTDGDGKIVAEAPFDLAVDSTKPDGHDKRLTPGLSCISCHSLFDGKSMYRDLENDFPLLPVPATDGYRLADVFGQSLDAPDGVVGRARREFSVAMSAIADDVDSLQNEIVATVHEYNYAMVTAEEMALDLGFDPQTMLSVAVTDDPEVSLAIQGVSLPRKSWSVVRSQLASLYASSLRPSLQPAPVRKRVRIRLVHQGE